ncbi:MAG: glycosyltransferase family 87 protein [Dissulfurispiraceae bacterium]
MKNINTNYRELNSEADFQGAANAADLEKSRKVSCIALIVFSGFILATLFNMFAPILLNKGYPYNTFLFTPADRYMDFVNIWGFFDSKLSAMLHARGLHFTYNPFAGSIAYLFALLPVRISLFVFNLLFSVYFIMYNKSFLFVSKDKVNSIINIGVLSFLSYPFLFAFDRGQFEVYVYIFLSLFMWFYINKKDIPAVIFLAAAIAMKIHPAVFIVLFLKDRKYKEAIMTLGGVLVLSVLSLLLLKDSNITLGEITQGLAFYSKAYVEGSANSPNVACGLGFGHSLFGIIRLLGQSLAPSWYFPNIRLIMQMYMLFALGFFSLIAAYIIFIEKTVWRQAALLVFSFNLLPYVSGDHKMLYLYIPLLLFANSNEETPFNKWYIILFGLLLIPKAYYFFGGLISDSGNPDISISIVISPLLLLIFCILIVYEGFKINELPWKTASDISA